MALDKVNYINGETVIYGENLNDIQDVCIELADQIRTDPEWGYLYRTDARHFIAYRMIKGLVHIRVNFSDGAANGRNPLGTTDNSGYGTLPAGYQPDATLYFPAYSKNGGEASLNVRYNGIVDLTIDTAPADFYTTAVYAPVQ